MTRNEIRELWKLCFNDSDEFIDMYFKLRYNSNVNVAIQSGEEVIAALQMLPYPMTFGDGEINTAYVSGACTHPDYRSRGVMRELLSQAFTRMLHSEVAVSTLIPAEPELFDYYARAGYAAVFNYSRNTFTASSLSPLQETVTLKESCDFKKKTYNYLNRKLKERAYCIQHTEADYHVIIADLKLNKGHVFTLYKGENITALAIAYPINGDWHIGEIVADNPDIKSLLLQRICEELKVSSIQVLTPPVKEENVHPLGMARIINAKTILQLYAVAHPEIEMNIELTDKQISANSGYYYINNGKCMNSAKRLPGSYLALTIGELAEKVFSPLSPYMSLMLN